MRLRYYFLLALLVFGSAGALAQTVHVPIVPVLLVIGFGETLLAFQVEHHKLGRFLRVMRRELKIEHPARMRHVH